MTRAEIEANARRPYADAIAKMVREREAIIDAALHLAAAYDDLLEAYGKPLGWGKINSQNVRDAIANARERP